MQYTKLLWNAEDQKYYAENGSESVQVGQVVFVDFATTTATYTNTAIFPEVNVTMTDSGYTAEQQAAILAEQTVFKQTPIPRFMSAIPEHPLMNFSATKAPQPKASLKQPELPATPMRLF